MRANRRKVNQNLEKGLAGFFRQIAKWDQTRPGLFYPGRGFLSPRQFLRPSRFPNSSTKEGKHEIPIKYDLNYNLGRIIGFYEKVKSKSNKNLSNAGIYLLDNVIFSEIPVDKKCSIEYEVFPKIVNKRFYGFITKEKFIDIGTPQRYRQAQIILRKQSRWNILAMEQS